MGGFADTVYFTSLLHLKELVSFVDLQNSKPVGCLILGPDGEIIQLSLYDNNQERGQGDNDMPQQQGGTQLTTAHESC